MQLVYIDHDSFYYHYDFVMYSAADDVDLVVLDDDNNHESVL